MKKLLKLGFLFVVLIGIAATAAADTITTSSSNLDFAVNDRGSFYVESSQIPPGAGSPPGVDASSSISGSLFNLIANSTGYSDAGLVLYFNNGGLRLGDLKSVSIVSTGSPLSINLWLDTGGDGKFFAFNSNGLMTGLNGDSYGSGSGSSLDENSSIYMTAGNGAGGTYTLAQLQTGVVPGINSDTRAALWIGITNNGSADIFSVTISTLGEDAALFSYKKCLSGNTTATGANVSSTQSDFPIAVHICPNCTNPNFNATEKAHFFGSWNANGKRVQFF